jgi:hypothetical protein
MRPRWWRCRNEESFSLHIPPPFAYIGGKGECNVNIYLFAAVILLLPALCTALGAAGGLSGAAG